MVSHKLWPPPAEVYPLLAPIFVALGAMTFYSTRSLIASPEVTISKSERAKEIADEVDYAYGKAWKSNSFRDFLHAQKPQILPGLNEKYGGAK